MDMDWLYNLGSPGRETVVLVFFLFVFVVPFVVAHWLREEREKIEKQQKASRKDGGYE